MHYWTCGSGLIELRVALEDAQACSHPGDCEADVRALMATRHIADQLKEIDAETAREVLWDYGAWNDDELSDHEANLRRIVWLACCDVAENPEDYA